MTPGSKTGPPAHYLNISQGVLCREPTRVITVLGSCVSVTLFSRRLGIGSIFHALMPQWKAQENGQLFNVFKYADSAVEAQLNAMHELGVTISGLECKVFGGANALFPHEVSVGDRNVRSALEALAAHKVRVKAMDVGGNVGRKLVFYSHTGDVFVKRLNQPECRVRRKGAK